MGSEWNIREVDENKKFWNGLLASYVHKGQQFIKPDVSRDGGNETGASRLQRRK